MSLETFNNLISSLYRTDAPSGDILQLSSLLTNPNTGVLHSIEDINDSITLINETLGLDDGSNSGESFVEKFNNLSSQLYSIETPSGHIWQLSSQLGENEDDIDKINNILGITDSTPSPAPGQQFITEKVDTITEAVTGNNGLSAQLYSRNAPSGHIWQLSSQLNDTENGAFVKIDKIADIIGDETQLSENNIIDKLNELQESLTGENGLSAKLYSETIPSGDIHLLRNLINEKFNEIDELLATIQDIKNRTIFDYSASHSFSYPSTYNYAYLRRYEVTQTGHIIIEGRTNSIIKFKVNNGNEYPLAYAGGSSDNNANIIHLYCEEGSFIYFYFYDDSENFKTWPDTYDSSNYVKIYEYGIQAT